MTNNEFELFISLYKDDRRFDILNLSDKQTEALQHLLSIETKYLFFGGGAGGGKSWLGCLWQLLQRLSYPETRGFLARKELKQLKRTTLKTFFKVARFFELTDTYVYSENRSEIKFANGSEIALLDLSYKPSDPLYQDLGSEEFTDGFIDESSDVKFMAFDVLKSRIGRWNNENLNVPATVLLTGNPAKTWTYKHFYRADKDNTLDKGYSFIKSLVSDNPNIDAAYIENLKTIRDKATKERLLYGNWEYDDDPNALIDYDSIIDIYSNTKQDSKNHYITADVARFGSDKAVILVWCGLKVVDKKVFDISKTTLIENAINKMKDKYFVPNSKIIIDEDGLGGGIVDHLACKGFKNGSKPLFVQGRKESFSNLKTQCYYKLADYINDSLISVSKDVFSEKEKELINEELEQVKSDKIDNDNKIYLISKEKVREIIGRSPDFSDALMMRMYFELIEETLAEMKIIDKSNLGIF